VIRELQVFKVRGTKHLLGRHVFEIAPDGLVVYPRFEALSSSSKAPPMHKNLLSVGIPSWDARIGGGVNSGSITCLLGSPGVGKTMMGLHFIAEGLERGEACLIVGFHESPETLVHKAERIGLDLARHLDNGLLKIMWQLPLEILIDDIASRMLGDMASRNVSRLLIDGAEGLDNLVMHPERSRGYLVALTNEFRLRGVTVYITQQLSYFRRALPEVTPSSSVLYENVMLLEYFALRAINHRMISVMKLRESAYDGANRVFTITEEGIVVGEPVSPGGDAAGRCADAAG
jgi:circadian clock protein KaiC